MREAEKSPFHEYLIEQIGEEGLTDGVLTMLERVKIPDKHKIAVLDALMENFHSNVEGIEMGFAETEYDIEQIFDILAEFFTASWYALKKQIKISKDGKVELVAPAKSGGGPDDVA